MSWLKLTGNRHDAWAALLVPLGMIVFSFLLTPNPAGYGTHRRLMLPPCAFRLATRQPCPFCGMTTGFTWMAHGNVARAAQCNLMAPPGFVATILFGLLGLYGVVSGRPWLPSVFRHPGFPRLLTAILAAFWLANLTLQAGWWHV